MGTGKFAALALAVVGVMGLGSASQAAVQIVEFMPSPISVGTPEFGITPNMSFVSMPGTVSNGDGLLAPAAQTPTGLQVETPFAIVGVPGSVITAINSTIFYDATLTLLPQAEVGAAMVYHPTFAAQDLGRSEFTITSTNVAGGNILLLSGTIEAAELQANITGSTVTYQSMNANHGPLGIHYNGGLIFQAMQKAGLAPDGDMAISMSSYAPLALGPAGAAPLLQPFQADATGLFNAVPEPASLSLVGLGALGLMARRRRA